jgi:pimeloyl-ACP methyl ester carboxylesterase
LFGIITEPRTGDGDAPIVICLNYGTAHHIGPSRLWVELAREWATHGVRVLRLDLSGVGDSPVRPGQRAGLSNAPEAFDDMVQVLTDLNSADPHDAVVVGVCSGAYLSIDVAALHGVRGIYALNANLRFEPDDLLAGAGDVNRALPPSRSFIRRVSASGLGDRLKDRLPPLLWHVLDRLHIHPAPTHALERIVDKGVDTFIGYGTDNLLTMLTQRSKYALRRLEQRPNFHLEVVDGMDHLLMLRRHRQRMADALTAHIVPKYASAGPTAPRSPVSTSES